MKLSFVLRFQILIFLYISTLLHAEQPITLFCHGVVDNKTQVDRYENYVQAPIVAFNFPDAHKPKGWNWNNLIFKISSIFSKKPINRSSMFLGQGPDITTIKNQIDHDKSYILYGVSRGGATIINYLAEHNPKNIAAVVIDGSPADMISTIDAIQCTIGYRFITKRSKQKRMLKILFPAYPIESIPSHQAINTIKNKKLPIFIVHSHQDTKVHIESAWLFYCAFKEAGFNNVYLCELENGLHAFYMHGIDKKIYLEALHSFYKKHRLAYNKEYAIINLQTLQPSVDEIQKKLTQYYKDLKTGYPKKITPAKKNKKKSSIKFHKKT